MNEATETTKNHILSKTTFASDAFFKVMLGKSVLMTINGLGTEEYVVQQVDQYNIIVETTEGAYLLVAKSAIIAVEAPDTAIPEVLNAIADGVQSIQYKASQKRLQQNKEKAFKPRPSFNRPQHSDGPRQQRQVEVVVKPKRSFDRA